MRVGVNLLWLRPGEVGGTESYVRRVLQAVSESDAARDVASIEWHLFGTNAAIESVRPTSAAVVFHEAPKQFVNPARRVVLERTWLRHAMGSGLDVIHHPGGTVPFSSPSPTLLTLHDLQPLEDPTNFGGAKRRFLERAIPAAINRAGLVVTPSDWVSERVRDRFSLSQDSVRTVSAFSEAVQGNGDVRPSAHVETLLEAGPVVLYPAMTMRHKNHRTLFRAFRMAQRDRPNLQLVCVGAIGRDHAELQAAASATSERIHLLGHVSKVDLESLLRRSEMMAFPSRYEGFGLPVLEAQQRGLPVAASTAGALPEVAGLGARLYDPDDIDGWAQAMREPLEGVLLESLVAAGLQNARRFTAASTAAQQQGAYLQLTL
jgi:glycosyltransferase involved in cell wall biosynthesis